MSDSPVGWAQTTLGEISGFPVEQFGPPSDRETFTYVDISSIDRETKRIANPQTLHIEQAPSRAKQRLEVGDVLVSMTRPNLNAVAIVPEELIGGIGSTGFHVLRTRHVLPCWMRYRVQAADFVHAMSMKVQGALYPAVRPNDIAQFPTSVPPRGEQDRIVAEIEKQFTRLDAATAALKRVQANLKRYRASVLKAACEGRLVPTEAELARKEGRDYEPASELLKRILRERRARWEADTLAKMIASGKLPKDDRWKQKYKEPSAPDTTNLPELPEGWCWESLDALIYAITAGKSIRCVERPPEDEEYGVVKVSSVTWGVFDELESKTCMANSPWIEAYRIVADDFLFSRANTIELVGACVIVNQVARRLMLSDKILRFEVVLPCLKRWLLVVLRSKWGRSEIERLSTGNQESMRNIGQDRIRSIRIPIPPLKELEDIISAVEISESGFMKLESSITTHTKRSANLRRAILDHAFTGQLVPQDPADEPASALLERIRAERAASGERKSTSRRKRAEVVHA